MNRLAPAQQILEHAIAQATTPGAQLVVRFADGHVASVAAGSLSYQPDATAVASSTVYDLASVTKVFTALALVRVANRQKISLGTPVSAVLTNTASTPVGSATLLELLTHRAGLLHWAPFFQSTVAQNAGTAETRELMLRAVALTERNAPGNVRYSDLGYILLGECLSVLAQCSIADAVNTEVLRPLRLDPRVAFRGVATTWRSQEIAPTEQCVWRDRVVQGEVHDENAYALGGECGHAGLFGTAADLCVLGTASLACLHGDDAWFDPDVMAWMIAPRAGGAHRVGWDARGDTAPSSGSHMGPRTFGHLGFTGTSLWCDPDAGVVVALVTNRVHPTRDNAAIRSLRPAIHDAVMEINKKT
jgi:serine-type D-Ala-D-Ala carboxypeptidase